VKTQAPKAVVSWSGGKDSCLAAHRAVAAGIRPQALLTAMIENGTRSRSHGLRLELLQAQARSLGLPLVTRATSWEDYDETMHAALSLLAVDGVEAGVFGDIDLEPHREWVAGVCARAGIEPFHPLWQEPMLALLAEPRFAALRADFHSFSGGAAMAKRLLARGNSWLGVSGMVTFKKADNVREPLTLTPPDRLLVETDTPYLAPVPYRGKPNEPGFVVDVALRLAQELGWEPTRVAAQTTANVRDLFAISI